MGEGKVDGIGAREIERLNSSPFNQKAHGMIEAAGERVDPGCLYSVQLALWAVRKGLAEADAPLRETLEAMMAWRPERLLNFFMVPEGPDPSHLSGWEDAQRPEDVAALVLDVVEARILIHFPWYYDLR
jgi:hypothetical protein